ncbi:MAG: Omp28-related outer membrane protein [Bacteroidetes bacterium]|nr:Omp28-related outer membrane protein [Bacteroidota bacterium]
MKKLFLYAIASGFLFTSCQKEDSNETTPNSGSKASPSPVVSPVPSSFVKKVLIEEFSSTSNGMSPESADLIFTIIRGNPDRIYHASLHSMDVMSGSQTNRLMTAFTPSASTLPCASIDRNSFGGNRYQTITKYSSSVNTMLAKTVNCGLAMRSSFNKTTAYVDVYAGFTSMATGTYKVTTYLMEDVVINGSPSYFQDNSSNGNPTSNFFNMGNPIVAFPHKNVVRTVLSADMGDSVNPGILAKGSTALLSYEIDMPNKLGTNSNWKIISFITDATTNEIINVQMSDLGKLKNWN